MVSIFSLISNSSRFFPKHLDTFPSAPVIIGITVILIFHSFLVLRQGSSICLFFRFLLFSFCGPSERQNPLDNFFPVNQTGLVFWPRFSDTYLFQNPREFSAAHSLEQILVYAYTIIIIIYSFRVFHIRVSWWFFTGVWVTASLLKSPGLVSGFWPFLAMLSFG